MLNKNMKALFLFILIHNMCFSQDLSTPEKRNKYFKSWTIYQKNPHFDEKELYKIGVVNREEFIKNKIAQRKKSQAVSQDVCLEALKKTNLEAELKSIPNTDKDIFCMKARHTSLNLFLSMYSDLNVKKLKAVHEILYSNNTTSKKRELK